MLPLLLCKTAAHDIIAQDARRNADVVAVNAGSLAGGHLQRDGSVTQLAGQRTGAAALTAQDQRHRAGQVRFCQRGTAEVRAVDEDIALLDRADSLGQVGHAGNGQTGRSTGAGLHDRTGHADAAALGDDHAVRTAQVGGAHDGPQIVRVLNAVAQHQKGLLAPGLGGAEQIVGRRFLDWPNNDNPQGLHAGLHGLLYWAFRCGLNICRSLETDTLLCRTALEKLRGYIPDCGECKAAAAIMTISGLSDCSQVLLRDPFRGLSTFYGCYMLYAQPTPNALEVIRRYWGGMLDYGATTFWEDFDLDWLKNTSPISELPVHGRDDLHADFGAYCYKGLRHSLCHGWASGPTSFLSRRIAGIRFLEPGGGTISISPDLCDLEYAAVRYPTPHGPVTVTAEKGKKPEIKAPSEVEIIESPQRT